MSAQWPNLLGLVNPPVSHITSLQAQLDPLPGWAIFHRSIAHDRIVFGGDDYRPYTQSGMGVICCLEWDPAHHGTLPPSALYSKFADQCRAYVNTSHGCHVWIIGEAMNYAAQWPLAPTSDASSHHEGPFEVASSADPRQRHTLLFPQNTASSTEQRIPIRPADYVHCYRLARDAIKSVPGHQHDLVLVGAVAPWNDDAKDSTIPSGDWVPYFQAIATALPVGACDGFAMHTATVGGDPDLLESTQTLAFPFGNRRAGFQCYLDFIAVIPEHHRLLPVFLTEVSQLHPWNNANDGWIMQACEQILDYNRTHDFSPIRCLALYQWTSDDGWSLRNRQYLLEDMKSALVMLEHQSFRDALWPVAWEQVSLPAHILPGKTFTVRLQFTNIGEQSMLCSGDDPVRVGYRFLPMAGDGTKAMHQGEMRIPLPVDVKIGESVSEEVRLSAPPVTGTYLLYLGFVKTQFVWSTASQDMAHRLELQVSDTVTTTAPITPIQPEPPTPAGIGPDHENPADPATNEDEGPGDTAQSSPEEVVVAHSVVAEGAVDTMEEVAMAAIEILDISAFLPVSRTQQPVRALNTLDRVIILETGVSANLPPGAMQAHFREFGMDQIPFHFMIDQGGTPYRLQDPTQHPDPYQDDLDQALVIGVEGQTTHADEIRTKLWAAAPACAQILLVGRDAGMPAVQKITIATFNGQPEDPQFGQDELDALCQHLTELSLQLAPADPPMSFVAGTPPIARTFGMRADTTTTNELLQEDPAATAELPQDTETVEDPPLSTPTYREESVLTPVPHEMTAVPLDLTAADLADLGYAHSDRKGVTLWLTEEPGDTPLPQMRRVHALRLQDILYHYVIDPEGLVYATHRNDRVDKQIATQYTQVLHIGLQGLGDRSGPTSGQMRACAQLLAHLASNMRLLDLAQCLQPTANTPLRIGTESWRAGQDWTRNVVRNAIAQGTPQGDTGKSEDPPAPTTAEDNEVQPSPPAADVPAPTMPLIRDPLPQTGTRVPQIVNKVGNLAQHPQRTFPVRDVATIRTICVHHANAPISIGPEQLAESWLLDQMSHEDPQPGLPYHYFIHPDGTIDQCNDIGHVCASVAQGNERIIAVCLGGKFTASLIPTPDQLEQTGVLLAWLMQQYFIPIEQVVGHKDIDDTETLCPGEDWNTGLNWRQTLMSYVNRYLHAVPLHSSPT